ncbi:ornithine cyclodeaminase family protein [Rhodoferax sp. GW822-FHT02A01]|uniref:ornithine cyclodeaminase family protein n=1 Tax=Rhodoferax sp. GW822-FHT02A01 TaxID=3141537 RepID=UPI00315D31CD
MQFFDQSAVARALPYPALIDALAQGLQTPIESPLRSHFEPNHDDSTVLIMPAWKSHEVMGVKLVSFWPDNGSRGKSTIAAVYVLMSCVDGSPLAVLDGTELTQRRTAAVAALGARILARKDSKTLAVLGTGSLSVPMVLAHRSVMDFERIEVWGRNPDKARAVVDILARQGVVAHANADLQQVVSQADVLCACSAAVDPFIRSEWVQPGTHVGLVGAFTPAMAEAEPALMARSQVFADSREAILQKGGEVLQAIQQGLMAHSDIQGEIAELAANPERAWRSSAESITVFKSVGFAALDLIAAQSVVHNGA